ncbi:MAG: hypothetical protein ACI8YQ_004103 [Polaribacter sp.]|jgi:hypothetical protein
MKYIKFIFILLLHFSLVQGTVAQSADTDENGRTNAKPSSESAVEEAGSTTSADQDVFRKRGHDFDDANAEPTPQDEVDTVFPDDLDDLRAEMSVSGFVSNKKIQVQLNALQEELAELRQYNELLRLENRAIRRSLGSCCTEIQDGLTAKDAYLLQNAPNPFNGSSDIEFFIPQDMESVTIEVRDLKGVLIKSFNVTEAGMGKITVDAKDASSGTYLYTLMINNEIIDSKVMILSK